MISGTRFLSMSHQWKIEINTIRPAQRRLIKEQLHYPIHFVRDRYDLLGSCVCNFDI